MSLARGRFGIEYNPDRRRNDSSPVGWFVVAMLAVAAVSFCCVKTVAFFRRAGESGGERPDVTQSAPAQQPSQPRDSETQEPLPGAQTWTDKDLASRPVKVRQLLQKLDEAERTGQIELAVYTIEELRKLPGAFDLDDRLARRLGDLNMRWLLSNASSRWVASVKVKKGDSASRIAFEHGSTTAMLTRLNPGMDTTRLRAGDTVRVMNHPRLTLAVDTMSGSADLNLNGRFFRRYDIAPGSPKAGIFTVEKDAKSLFAKIGLSFQVRDRIELDSLMPRGSIVTVLAR